MLKFYELFHLLRWNPQGKDGGSVNNGWTSQLKTAQWFAKLVLGLNSVL